MDIKISGIDDAVIARIDIKAKALSIKLDRKISRNEYIKRLVNANVMMQDDEIRQDKFDKAIELFQSEMRDLKGTIQEYLDSNSRLFYMVASGVDIDEIENDEYEGDEDN